MRIFAHLCQSRHGVYYFRQTSTVAGKQIAKKLSLYTKDPVEAKEKAIQLLALMSKSNGERMNKIRRFEMVLNEGGVSFKLDKDDPDDVEKLGRFLRQNPEFSPKAHQPVKPEPAAQGVSFDVIIQKYTERYEKKWAPKTLYGYLQNINIFKNWAEKQLGKKPFPITIIDRKIIALYIQHLRSLDINDNTIAKNYLICLNGIFDFAKSIGDYPDIDAPSRKHNLIDNKTKKEKPRNPFTTEELRKIFAPENLPVNSHPEQFFAPILGLFTGARISEICQLHTIDIGKKDQFYTISINDEELKRIKSPASRRIIPIHPILEEIGFIDYLEDMKKFGNYIFPTVNPDKYGYFGKEPGRRWAKYLDKLGITDPTKVFHSFRSTANIKLMDNGIEEEKRCAFIGHDHNTVNSKIYGHKGNTERSKFEPEFLFELIVPKLNFDVDFSKLKYKKGMFDKFIYRHLQKEKAKNLRAQRLAKSPN